MSHTNERLDRLCKLFRDWREELEEFVTADGGESKRRLEESLWLYDLVQAAVDIFAANNIEVKDWFANFNGNVNEHPAATQERVAIHEITAPIVAAAMGVIKRQAIKDRVDVIAGTPLDAKAFDKEFPVRAFVDVDVDLLQEALNKLQDNEWVAENLMRSEKPTLEEFLPRRVEVEVVE